MSNYVAFAGAGTRAWAVKSREPGLVKAAITRPTYELNVAVSYDDRQARVSILDSTGLHQEDGKIHGNAVSWILKLEGRIRAEFDRMASAI